MKLLILGAVGEMCTPATRDVLARRRFSKVTLADANLDKVKRLAREAGLNEQDACCVDAGDPHRLGQVVAGHDVVINGTPKPFAMNVLRAVLDQRASCCDLGSPDERMAAFDQQARELGVSYVAGMGATPGITNIMARHGVDMLDSADEIQVCFAAIRPFALSPALLDTLLWEFEPGLAERAYFQEGVFYPVPPFTGERLVDFGYPIGPQRVYFVPHGETRSFPVNLGVRKVMVRGTFSPKDMRLVRALLEYGFFDTRPIRVKDIQLSPKELIKEALLQMPEATINEDLFAYGLHVEVFGRKGGLAIKRTYWTSHPGMQEWGVPFAYSNPVGLPLSICAEMLANGEVRAGVNSPDALIAPEPFFAALAERRIMVHYREDVVG